jgi:hypothetical protein
MPEKCIRLCMLVESDPLHGVMSSKSEKRECSWCESLVWYHTGQEIMDAIQDFVEFIVCIKCAAADPALSKSLLPNFEASVVSRKYLGKIHMWHVGD